MVLNPRRCPLSVQRHWWSGKGPCLLRKSWEEWGTPHCPSQHKRKALPSCRNHFNENMQLILNSHVRGCNINVSDTCEGDTVPASLTHQKVLARRGSPRVSGGHKWEKETDVLERNQRCAKVLRSCGEFYSGSSQLFVLLQRKSC